MEDIASAINNILNSKEGMEKLQDLANSLGLGGSMPPNGFGIDNNENNFNQNDFNQNNQNQASDQKMDNVAETLTGIMNSLGLNNNQQSSQNQQGSGSSIPNIDVNMIMNIQKAMSAFGQSNKNVELLRSLKPHFSETRQKKVDDAIKIMQLINMLPMLKESGLFGFLGGDKEWLLGQKMIFPNRSLWLCNTML